jgi:hypothetical protein
LEKKELNKFHMEAICLTLESDVKSQEYLENLKNLIGTVRNEIKESELKWILKDCEIIGGIIINI